MPQEENIEIKYVWDVLNEEIENLSVENLSDMFLESYGILEDEVNYNSTSIAKIFGRRETDKEEYDIAYILNSYLPRIIRKKIDDEKEI